MKQILDEMIPFKDPNFKDKMEPGIYPLVSSMNKLGFKTYKSCEGHSEASKDPDYPYILWIREEGDKTLMLQKLLREVNNDNIYLYTWAVDSNHFVGICFDELIPNKTNRKAVNKNIAEFAKLIEQKLK
jgi:hypothetical protein